MKRNRTMQIFTPRLCLHAMTPEDEEAVVGMFLDEEVSRTYMIPRFAAPEEASALFHRFRALSADPARFVYGVYLDAAAIGFVNEVARDEDGMEVGYVIAPGHKNRGYATEVLTAVIRELFGMGYAVVRAGAFAENAASMRVMEKCGMVCLGRGEDVEYRGTLHSCVDYEIRAGADAQS